MRRLAAVALALAAVLPACAQRGAGRGGFAGHSAPAGRSAPGFHGTFAPPESFRYASAGLVRAPGYPSALRMLPPQVRYPGSAPLNRPMFYQNHHGVTVTTTHHIYINGYPHYGYSYYSTAVYVPYGGFSDNDDDSDSSQQPAPLSDDNSAPNSGYAQPDLGYAYPEAAAQPGYGYPQPMAEPQPYPQQQPAPQVVYAYPGGSSYQVYVPAPSSQMEQPGVSDLALLIYKDGRPPEQIQNYLATRTTITVLDSGRPRVIPLSDVNLPATITANRQAGVEFNLPTALPNSAD